MKDAPFLYKYREANYTMNNANLYISNFRVSTLPWLIIIIITITLTVTVDYLYTWIRNRKLSPESVPK